MKKELDEKLVKSFPLLYGDRKAPKQSTAMCWGFECGDGWFDIIWNLSEKLEPLIQDFINDCPDVIYYPKATQVKEKFGTLRFYMTCGSDEIYDMIHEAEELSSKTCESCGNPGESRGGGWIFTHCETCHENYERIRKKNWGEE